MKHDLKTKLSISHISVSLIIIILISIFTNVFFERQFREYVIKKQDTKNKEIVNMINAQYSKTGNWNIDMMESIGIGALENGLIISVKDINGKIIWDATAHNNGLCKQMISHMAENMSSRYSNWQGEYTETNYDIISNSAIVGSIDMGYYGPFYYNDVDLRFINTLNIFLIIVAMFSFILSLIIGRMMARRMSNPISRVINSAKLISEGDYSAKIVGKSNTVEINQLIATVNNLALNLETQENLRKRLTSDVAHELRTPLTTLQSHFEAMIDGVWDASIDRLKSCHEEIIRINKLVGDIEKLSSIESDNLILNKSKVNLVDLINNIIKQFESDFIKKNIGLNIIGKEIVVNVDKDKISQVIVNLLSNAQKYTRAGGEVSINIKDDGDSVEINVKDNGIGIEENDLLNIFQRFYRADRSRSRLTGGAGIGLAITKAIVEAHKGSIKVKSDIDIGTDFIIKLPKD